MKDFLPHISELLDGVLLSLRYFLPELLLTVLFVLAILTDLFVPRKNAAPVFWIVLVGLIGVGALSYQQLDIITKPLELFHNVVVLDSLGIAFKLIFCLVSVLFVLFVKNNRELINHRKGVGDLYIILLAVQLGLHLMAMSSNLVMIFISIEMVSIGSYLMVGYVAGDNKQTEAAMKYVLFGSVSSAVMLYGMSLLYGFTGTLDISSPEFLSNLAAVPSLGVGVAIAMILVGIGFKLAFVPFHFWSPDVYQGAPTPVTAFLSTGPKIAGFAILLHFLSYFQSYSGTDPSYSGFQFNEIIIPVAILTMIVGNFSAIWQDNIKRMLAYSSIGHTGFILLALLSLSPSNYGSVLFYLLAYAIMNMAGFMLVDRVESKTGAVNISEYKGLGNILKVEMLCFVIILVSLTGLPPTAGFFAKFLVFSSALEYYTSTGSIAVLIALATGAVTTVVSLFYYFKVPLNAYLRKGSHISAHSSFGFITSILVFLSFLLVVAGVFPESVTSFIKDILFFQ